MGKTSSKVRNRYKAKAYDRIEIIVPKGRKQDIEAHAQSKGESVNSLLNTLVRQDMGVSEAEWKKRLEEADPAQ